MNEVTKEEFRSWKQDKVTQTVFLILEELKHEYTDELVSGKHLKDSVEQAKIVGRIEAFSSMLNLEYESDDLEGA